MALPTTKTKEIEQFFIGEPPKKRRVVELASKLAKSIAEKMKDNKPQAPKPPKPPKRQSAPNAQQNQKVKKPHLKPDRTSKQVLAKNVEP